MSMRQLLLRLKLSAGIGLKGEAKVAQWLADHPGNYKQLMPDQIAEIANLTVNRREQFLTSFLSQKVTMAVNRHLSETHFVTLLDKGYPAQLKESWQPPVVLFYQGDLSLATMPHQLGVVGARKSTPYSRTVLNGLLPQLVETQTVIVSGLAEGVDSLSHRLTLQHGGHTIGVIATGLNLSYPASSQRLQRYMGAHELVFSEYPLDAVGKKYHFIERNRIIAGLSQSVLVVQAKKKSGSLITASLALQDNRNVLAIPGRVDDEMSEGCNQLIQAGAKPVLTAQDILDEFV